MIRRCDIVFVMHRKSWISRAIAWFMGSRWSHSALVVDPGFRTWLCETSDFHVNVAALERYLEDPSVEVEIWGPRSPLDSALAGQMADRALARYGEIYGYLQLFSLGIRRLLMRVGIRIPNFIRTGLVCTAIPLEAYRISGIPGLHGIDPESIDTEELYQLVSTSGHFVRIT